MTVSGTGHRVIALVGPQSGGKTSLLEAILTQTGKLEGKGKPGSRQFGDTSAEAKSREMGTELNIARTEFMGDPYTFIDCPGATELMQEAYGVLSCVDAAIIVTEPDPDRILGLSPLLKRLEILHVPHYIFVNKIDRAAGSLSDLADALNKVSGEAIVLRQIPIRDGENITGYVDLASERAYVYKSGSESEIIEAPEAVQEKIAEARYTMMETLADHDEHLMEELLEDITPPKDEIFKDLSSELEQDLIIPVLLGSATNQNGVHRLLKAIRHEVPDVEALRKRLDLDSGAPAKFGVVTKTFHTSHGGKLSMVRVLNGEINDGDTLNGDRIAGMLHMHGDKVEKCQSAPTGDFVGLGRLDSVTTGNSVSGNKEGAPSLPGTEIVAPVYSLALSVANRNDEVKLATSLAKICDEDPSLVYEHVADTNETVIRGQGEVHLQIAADRLSNKYGLKVQTQRPKVPYKETIRKSTTQHSRFKKQSGGHGQFGDVVIEVSPLPSGSGFTFGNKITGGAIPRQYIPSVEHGVQEYLKTGPLGFTVVDIGVVLTDGSFHAVDSSDMAFKTAGRLAMSEAMPNCSPVLLEPIMLIKFMVPSEFTPKINSLISGRRGQILGFDGREGWDGWDTVEAYMPQSETHDIIIELRSMTLGSGTFISEFDHVTELTGRLADQVLTTQAAE